MPHQFLFERKLKLPSRRNRHHRRFYTPSTLLSDIEEAIDPCELRVRLLGEVDAGFTGYNFGVNSKKEPEGGQDIVSWPSNGSPRLYARSELDLDELWMKTRGQAGPFSRRRRKMSQRR